MATLIYKERHITTSLLTHVIISLYYSNSWFCLSTSYAWKPYVRPQLFPFSVYWLSINQINNTLEPNLVNNQLDFEHEICVCYWMSRSIKDLAEPTSIQYKSVEPPKPKHAWTKRHIPYLTYLSPHKHNFLHVPFFVYIVSQTYFTYLTSSTYLISHTLFHTSYFTYIASHTFSHTFLHIPYNLLSIPYLTYLTLH